MCVIWEQIHDKGKRGIEKGGEKGEGDSNEGEEKEKNKSIKKEKKTRKKKMPLLLIAAITEGRGGLLSAIFLYKTEKKVKSRIKENSNFWNCSFELSSPFW